MPMPFSMPSRVPSMPPQRPIPKPPEKPPASQPAKGLFGKDTYLEFGGLGGLKERIRKDEYYKPAPGYSNSWGRDKREAFMDEIRKLGGNTYGLQKNDAPQIIRKMEEAKRAEPGKSGEWDQKIKTFKSWIEGN